MGRQGGHGQVESLDPQGGDADDHPQAGGDQAGQGDAEEERQTEADAKKTGRKGADGHEGGVAQRDQAGETGQDIQADGPDDGDADPVGNVKQIAGRIERQREDQADQQEHQHPGAARVKDGHVRRVAGLEISALHGYTLSILRLPNRPYGFNIRIRIRAM